MKTVTMVLLCVLFGLLAAHLVSGGPANRIVNGVNANIADHPHQISLEWSSSGAEANFRHICGGSIISDYWVVTAAHCVEMNSSSALHYRVALNDGTLTGKIASIPLNNVIPHPEYNVGNGAYPNDIALLELSQPVSGQSSTHAAAELAASGANFNGQTCTISGWGLTEGNGNTLPNVLQQTTGTIITPFSCSLSFLLVGINADAHICIDNPNTGACNGDSGGPMICSGVLAGVTSFGAAGCATSTPSVYARVSNYRSWISSVAGV